MTPSRKEASELLIGPSSELVQYLVEEMMFASLAERAIYSLSMLPTLLETAEAYTKLVAAGEHSICWDEVRRQIHGLDGLAKQEEETGFMRLRAHGSVAMWSVLEGSVDDLCINLALLFPERLYQAASKPLPEDNVSPETIKKTFRHWKADVSGTEHNVIKRQLFILSTLRLSCFLDDNVISVLTELSEAKNLIIHRRSIVDDKFLSRCPGLSMVAGDRYVIDREKFLSFYDAVGAYSGVLLKGCTDLVLSGVFRET